MLMFLKVTERDGVGFIRADKITRIMPFKETPNLAECDKSHVTVNSIVSTDADETYCVETPEEILISLYAVF